MVLKNFFFLIWMFSVTIIYAQVGINTENPKGTLHVAPTDPNGTNSEGIIAPNLTRSQLIIKDSNYTSDERGAIVYVTNTDGTANTKTSKITSEGYYYFDGTMWQPFATGGTSTQNGPWNVQRETKVATSNNEDIYQMGSVAIGSDSAGTYNFHVTGDEYISGVSKIGGTTSLSTSTQLELGDDNKGFLPNRVALVAPTNPSPLESPVDGVMVYNTATVRDEGLRPGYHFWANDMWNRFADKASGKNISMFYQTSSVVAGKATGGSFDYMTSLKFSTTGSSNLPVDLTLPEDGSYAFAVKLYSQVCNASTGLTKTPTYSGKVVIYVGIWLNNVLQDVSEVFVILAPFADGSSAPIGDNVMNIVLGCTGYAGDVVDIRLGYFSYSLPTGDAIRSYGATSSTPRSDRTSMLFWKL